MNVLNFYVKLYGSLHNRKWIRYRAFNPLRSIVRKLANWHIPRYLSQHISERKGAVVKDLIVSFTSFPVRIDKVWMVVECLKRQTVLPEKMILWLSKEQFPDVTSIPASLREREGDMLEIRMVEGDIRSHKKYHYVSKEYADSLVFLIDDDIYYPTDILERTMTVHKEHPEAIICNYGYHIGYKENGELMPYNSWPRERSYSTGDDLFFGSGGGTLLRPSWLHEDLTNIELALKLTPIADDIWLNAMVSMAGREKVMLPNGQVLPIAIKGNVKLESQNKGQNRNDEQINSIMAHYKIES